MSIQVQNIHKAFGDFVALGDVSLDFPTGELAIEMHGGRIWAESMEGLGSKFIFLLPLHPKSSEPDPVQPFVE